MQNIFISYSRQCIGFVDDLAHKFQKQGFPIWTDYLSLVPGRPWAEQIEKGLREAAQTALGVDVDGKWGPKTEDAIQQALASKSPCTKDECGAPGPAPTGSSDALRGVGAIGKFVIGAVAVTGVAVGIALWTREG